MSTELIWIGREQYEEQVFRRGGSSTIYFLTDNLLGKFIGNGRGSLRADPAARKLLQREAKIAQFLYENDVPVARPYGVHDIPLHYSLRQTGRRVEEKFPCFVQEFLDVPMLRSLEYIQRVEGMVMARRLLEELGERVGLASARDALSESNILFNPTSREIRLVDFAEWAFQGMEFE
ncbi:Uncharacterised protein [uncultured archaeon]|nr:Uncharacterised protein [uncultured archaeon]